MSAIIGTDNDELEVDPTLKLLKICIKILWEILPEMFWSASIVERLDTKPVIANPNPIVTCMKIGNLIANSNKAHNSKTNAGTMDFQVIESQLIITEDYTIIDTL